MKAIEFPEVNVRIAENQQQYETLPVYIDTEDPTTPTTMCIRLDHEEIKQVAETGLIWLTTLTFMQQFHPIKMSLLKPENCTEPDQKMRLFEFNETEWVAAKTWKDAFEYLGLELSEVKSTSEIHESSWDEEIECYTREELEESEDPVQIKKTIRELMQNAIESGETTRIMSED